MFTYSLELCHPDIRGHEAPRHHHHHQELYVNRVPGEIKRREVELDPQVSPEEIMGREVELGCELDFFRFGLFLNSTVW